MSTQVPPHERQYTVINPDLIETTIIPDADSQLSACPARLREISNRDMGLLVIGPPRLPQKCQIWIESPRLDRSLILAGEIQSARPNAAGDWLVRYDLMQPLSADSFASLINSGLLERRATHRDDVQMSVQVQWNPASKAFAGTVRDVSPGGLCLISPERPMNARNFYIVGGDSSKQVPLKVQWSVLVGRHYLIGCEFTDPRDYSTLRAMQAAGTVASSRKHEIPPVAGCAAIV